MPTVPFTVENAREMSKRANEVRWSRERERRAQGIIPVAKPKTPEAVPIATPDDNERAEEIRMLRAQIAHFDTLTLRADDPKELQMLANARWKAWETWRILSGIPMPGSRKPAADKPQRQRGTFVDPT